jgi:hypothetical protein
MQGFARSLSGPDRGLADDHGVREALLVSLLEGLRQGGAATVEDYAIEGLRPVAVALREAATPRTA